MRNSKSTTTVVVIDDDYRVRESLINLLNASGFTVLAFSSAVEFLQSNAIESAHCVISDVAMPGMNGFELCSLLFKRNPNLPVVLISGRDYGSLQRAGPVDVPFLQKPLDGEELIRVLAAVLAKNRQ